MGAGRNAGLVVVAVILADHHVFTHIPQRHATHRAESLDFFIAQRVGGERVGRVHGDQRQQLQQVVLEHVLENAGAVIVLAALAHNHVLGHGDLYLVDVVPVPDGLEDGIGEPEHQEVLHRLLAQVVVNAIDLLLTEYAVDVAVQLLSGLQVGSEGLFDHDAPPTLQLVRHARVRQGVDHRFVQPGSQREVVQAVERVSLP